MSESNLDLARLDPRQRRLLETVLRKRGVDLSQLPVTPRHPEDDPVPLSHAQERLWVLDRLDPGRATYNEAYAVDLAGPLHPAVLGAALGDVVGRHEGLRTRFPAVDQRPVQVVGEPAPVPLPRVDLEALPARRRDEEAQRLTGAEARRPFDLPRGPVLRALLLRRDAADHRLLLTLHHVVCDARSLGIVFTELQALYAARLRGEPARLPEPPVQYPDFALWQRRYLTEEVLQREVGWWRRSLDGFPTRLELPTDLPRKDEEESRGGRVDLRVENSAAAALQGHARAAGATSFMAWLALFAALLHRYAGQERLLVGSPVENRQRPELADVVGFFVNTLALPLDLSGDPGLRELLDRVRRTTVEAYDHQDLPFSRLVEAMQAERTPRNLPLVQVFFVLQRTGQTGSAPRLPKRDGEMAFRPRPVETGTAKFDLTLVIDARPGEVRGHLDYDTHLFLPETARRLVANLQTLLAAAVAEPDRPLSTLPVLAPEERRQVLESWRGSGSAAPPAPAVLDEIGRRAAEDPTAPALLTADGRTVSYGELTGRASALAGELVRRGVGPERPVAVIGGRTPETVVGILAVLAAGGAYVPFDPELPAARRRELFAAAGIRLALAPASLDGEELAGLPDGVVEIGEAGAVPPGEAFEEGPRWPRERSGPQGLAYVIHTSGSTGTPKGVMVSDGALAHLVRAFREALSLTPRDRLLMVPAPSFDASVGNVFPVLAAGATLVLHPDPSTLAPDVLGRLLDDLGVTIIDLPAAFWKGWVDALSAGDAVPPRALRLAISGGESLEPERVRAWEEHTGAVLFGPYGPTEATVCATAYTTSPGWSGHVVGGRLPIGRPLPHVEVAVVDRHGQPVPVGVPGELLLGGLAVARGYLGRPAETADRFRPDPWGGPGSRAYHTGDLGRWLTPVHGDGGNLEFEGRRDHQVKVRGYRIEPGEVESHLRRHPAVRDVVVAALREGPAHRLVAWVVGHGGPPPPGRELAAFLATTLPEHMVPSAFVPLNRLPTTSRGKVDRDALPSPEEVEEDEAPAVAPRNDVEAALARTWCEVLGRDEVDVHGDFFRLGGDSILALRIASRARREGLVVEPRQLFRHRTVAELARVARPLTAGTGTEIQGATEDGSGAPGPVPLTPIQHWYLDLYGDPERPGFHHWNQAVVWEVVEGTRDAAWQRALSVLRDRHDALRLRLRRAEGDGAGWRQETVAPGGPSPFTAVDLTALAPARREREWHRVAAAVQGSLDPGRGPLLRLVRVAGAGEAAGDRLLLAVHHLGIDTASWATLVEDLQSAYVAAAKGAPAELPPATTPFRTWARHLEGWAASPEGPRSEAELWRRQTPDDLPPLPQDLPGDPEADRVDAAASLERYLDAKTTAGLEDDLQRVFGVGMREGLLAALALAFRRWTGEDRLLVELEGHGREDLFPDLDLSRSVGWFTAAHPVLLSVPRPPQPTEMLKEVKERLRAIPHHGLGYGVLRWLAEDDGGLAGRPRPELALNYLGRTGPATGGDLLAPSTATPGPLVSPRGLRPFPLEVAAAVRRDRLWMLWTWSPGRHHRTTVGRLADDVLATLRELAGASAGTAERQHTPSDFPHARLDRRGLDKLATLLERTDAAATGAGDKK